MRKCTQIDKVPLVSILLAVYKPNETWFIEQLISLNEQTYCNIELIVYDDCPEYPVNEELINKYITKFSYTLIRGTENKGSNKAFEELTKVGKGEIFAYCDQDDIWEKEKIAVLIDSFVDEAVTLVCSDLSIIDENGNKTANSMTKIRKRIKYKRGYGLAKGLLLNNFVTGCAMLVRKEIARKAIPFEPTLFHDNWIAIIAALNGKIEFVDKSLVKYRQHSFNQTGILKGVHNKETYYNIKIEKVLSRYNSLQKRLGNNDKLRKQIVYCVTSLKIRKGYYLKPSLRQINAMIKYSRVYKTSIILEIFMPIMPEFIFKVIIKLAKKGLL